MLLSYRNKFLFVHVYKAAGTSIAKTLRTSALNLFELLEYKITDKLNLDNPYCPLPDHPKAKQIRNKIGYQKYDNLFKFAFVRNPWDLQVSLYKFMVQNVNHFQHDIIKTMSFNEYVDWRITQNNDLQQDFITDENGNVIVDFVGKFENLESDFEKVCQNININAKLPHLNSSSRQGSYKDYYDDRTKDLIYDCFKADVELFDYSF